MLLMIIGKIKEQIATLILPYNKTTYSIKLKFE